MGEHGNPGEPPGLNCLDRGLIERFASALRSIPSVMDRLAAVLLEPDDTLHYGVLIDVMELLEVDPELGNLTVSHPTQSFESLGQALQMLQSILIEEGAGQQTIFKPLVHARVIRLPKCPKHFKANVSAVRSRDVGNLVSLPGTVIRTGTVKMLEFAKEYECSKCGHLFRVFSDIEQQNVINIPSRCPNPSSKRGCQGTIFNLVDGSHICRDYQEIKIQEQGIEAQSFRGFVFWRSHQYASAFSRIFFAHRCSRLLTMAYASLF